ncbi:MAG: hypothetical protein AAFN78_18750, partial [Pseudomonadota bacterium]
FQRLQFRAKDVLREHRARIAENASAELLHELGGDAVADGIGNIVETQAWVAENYFKDGSIDAACPPLRALLSVMAYGEYEGMDYRDAGFRALFTREALMSSDWYQQRLDAKQQADVRLWQRHRQYLEAFLERSINEGMSERIDERGLQRRIDRRLETFQSDDYRERLNGCLGLDPGVFG